MPSVDLHNVSVRFPVYFAWSRSIKNLPLGAGEAQSRRKLEVEALTEVSLSLAPGDRLAVLGANGSGKSTLLRVLGGILKPTQGEAEISGTALGTFNTGFGFHSRGTGYDNIVLTGQALGKSAKEIRDVAEEISRFVGSTEALDLAVDRLSPGDLFHLSSATMLFFKADIMVFDEVFEGADPDVVSRVKEHILSTRADDAVVAVVERSRSILDGFCAKALVLEKGRIADFGDYESVMERHGQNHTF